MNCVSLRLACAAAVSVSVFATAPAVQADPALEAQVNAIVNTWFGQDTAANRRLATLKPLQVTLGRPQQAHLPSLGRGRFPAFSPREKAGKLWSRLPSVDSYFYKDTRGLATLLITKDGPAVRLFKGHYGKRVPSGQKVFDVRYSKPRKLQPSFLPKKMGYKVARWRAKRMVRAALKAGPGPSTGQIRAAFRSARAPLRARR